MTCKSLHFLEVRHTPREVVSPASKEGKVHDLNEYS